MADELDFSGKTVLVIGGSSGIGNAIARAFLEHGARVHVCATRAAATDYAGAAGSDLAGLRYQQLDAGDAAAIAAMQPAFERLDVLVQSQGTVLYERREFADAGFRQVLEVNLSGVMSCAMKFRPMLQAARGTMITVSSTAAFHSTRGNPAYNASKAGLVGLTRTLGEAWAADGIRVNGIAPGFVATRMTQVTTGSPRRMAAALGRIPLARMGEPREMAGVALFLASPLASYVVGQTIVVDGGLLLG